MIFQHIKRATVIIALSLLMLPALSLAEEDKYHDFSKMTPSGTFDFAITSVKLIAGASWGEGTLHYQGNAYKVKVKALSVGGIGYREIKSTGELYDLNKLEDFPGIYSGGAVGATAGDGSIGTSVVENLKNVILRLKVTDSKGLQLSVGLGGVEVKFAE